MPELPTGTVTFLFTDIEGSTTRWEHHPEAMREALARHDTLLRSVITSHGGYVFKMVGDAVYAAFAVPADAVASAVAAQRSVAAEEWGEVGPLRVRMALHTGAAQSRDDDYFGPTLNRIARVLSTGYGGQILLSAATVELIRDTLPAGASLKDLGEHALKDLLRREHVFQLIIPDLPADFPALKSLSHQPHNLPVQPTPFLGRDHEVASVCDLLGRPEVRLVTLTGPGGIGKTRLGLQVGAEMADQCADGVWFVTLAPLSDAQLVVPTIMQALSISEAGGQPPLTPLKTALKDKQMLLLLDNFEQVVEAAPVVAELIASCPKLTVLVTSRVVLRVQAEREFSVPALSLPDPKRLPDLVTLSQYTAVALFIERAQAVKPDFAVTNGNAPAVAAICAHLDGLPLAIELAAARSKLLSPQALLARLSHRLAVLTSGARDVPARHQTLRNTIAWSYDLLDSAEQQLFWRLATFVGGSTLEAVEEVYAALDGTQAAGWVLDGVGSLLDKSLLHRTEQEGEQLRMWTLETIREFGVEVLAASGEMELVRRAHADYYLALAEQAEPKLFADEQQSWFDRLEQEHDNLRAALSWLLEREEAEMALRVGGALWWFWGMRNHASEGRQWMERALSSRGEVRASVRAKALNGLGLHFYWQSDYDRAAELCGESLALFREVGDKTGIATALSSLGMVEYFRSNYAAAWSLDEEALTLWREVDANSPLFDYSLTMLGVVAKQRGEYAKARVLAEEAATRFRERGDIPLLSNALLCLVEVMVHQGDLAGAHALAEENLRLTRQVDDLQGRTDSLILLGQMALLQGDDVKAYSLFEESVELARERGEPWYIAKSLSWLARVTAFQSGFEAARPMYEESLAIAGKIGSKEIIATTLEGWASAVATQGEAVWAAQIWGAAEALRKAIGAPLPSAYSPGYEQAVASARAQLGEEAFAAAWDRGRAMPLEQIVNEGIRKESEPRLS